MAESIYLLLPRTDGTHRWLLVDALGNRIGLVQRGSLAEAAAHAQGRRLTVLVPGEHVTLLHADIPSRSAQKILQAAPYMLEDRLAADVESLHFAAGPKDAGAHLVSAVARARMHHWLELLAQAGLRPVQLVPDVCALAPVPDAVTVAIEAGHALVRFPDGGGYTAEQDLALKLLKRRLATPGMPLKRVVLHAAEPGAFAASLVETGAEVEQKALVDGLLPMLVTGLRVLPPLSLLQGAFQIRNSFQEHWRVWRTAATLLGVCLMLAVLQQAIAYVHLKRQAMSLDAEVNHVFSQAMPGSQPVSGREDDEMRGLLGKLQGGGSAGSLLPLLDALGGGLTANPSVQVMGLNFQGGSLQVQLQAGDVSALDALKAALARQNGVSVSLDSVNASGNQVTGRIVLSEGSS